MSGKRMAAAGLTALGGYEVLGADRGVPLTSVQAPLGAAFKFNGWVGKFTTAPPDGVRDAYATIGYAGPKPVGGGVLGLNATWHDFTSDRIVRHYGTEIDLLATWKRGPQLWSLRYGRYRADGFATDTEKAWVQVDVAL